jgi:hypothetical protein
MRQITSAVIVHNYTVTSGMNRNQTCSQSNQEQHPHRRNCRVVEGVDISPWEQTSKHMDLLLRIRPAKHRILEAGIVRGPDGSVAQTWVLGYDVNASSSVGWVTVAQTIGATDPLDLYAMAEATKVGNRDDSMFV